MSNQQGNSSAKTLLIAACCIFGLWFLAAMVFGFRPFWGMHRGSWSVPLVGFGGFFGLGFLLSCALAIWVGFDAKNRGMNGLLWGLLVFFTSIIGLIIYLIVTQTGDLPAAKPTSSCAGCGAKVDAGFKVCPYCARSLSRSCPRCGKDADPAWKVCPYCAADLTQGPPAPPPPPEPTPPVQPG